MKPVKISLSKILAFIAPGVSTLAATAATWLVVHVHLFATFHVTSSALATSISSAVIWGVTAVGTYLVQHKIISGQIVLENAKEMRRLGLVPPIQAPSKELAG
jgi:hypothetical protein